MMTRMKDDGGPAFPTDPALLRDWFAWNASAEDIRRFQSVSMVSKVSPEVARYRFADAMIATRLEAAEAGE